MKVIISLTTLALIAYTQGAFLNIPRYGTVGVGISPPYKSTNLGGRALSGLTGSFLTYPNTYPSSYPSNYLNNYPSTYPSSYPSTYPSNYPSTYPNTYPSTYPSTYPNTQPSTYLTTYPSTYPGAYPSTNPSNYLSSYQNTYPSVYPSTYPNIYSNLYPKQQHHHHHNRLLPTAAPFTYYNQPSFINDLSSTGLNVPTSAVAGLFGGSGSASASGLGFPDFDSSYGQGYDGSLGAYGSDLAFRASDYQLANNKRSSIDTSSAESSPSLRSKSEKSETQK